MRDSALLESVLKAHRIEAVIHFAGLKAVGESVEQPLAYYDNNVAGALSLVNAMQNAGVRTLVFSSSATVYGEPQYIPIDESHPTLATSPYGRTKLHIEEMLSDLSHSDDRWRIACLRYFNPVGAHETALIGESPAGIPQNLMPYMSQVAFGTLPILDVFGNDYDTPDGSGVRDYIHVMDLAEGHSATLGFLEAEKGWHVLNLGTGVGYSVLDMIEAFELASGRKVAYQISSRRAGDVAQCYSDPSKAKSVLSWRAVRGLDEMCSSAWAFQQREGQRPVFVSEARVP